MFGRNMEIVIVFLMALFIIVGLFVLVATGEVELENTGNTECTTIVTYTPTPYGPRPNYILLCHGKEE